MPDPWFCPRCGRSALTAITVKEYRCAACGFVFYHNVAAAVMALLSVGERLVVALRGREPGLGRWDLPGGFMEPLETAEDGLRREILEELGIGLPEVRYVASFWNTYPYLGVTYHTLDLVFAANLDAGVQLVAADDVAEVLLVRPEEIDLDRFAFRSAREAARIFLEDRTRRASPDR